MKNLSVFIFVLCAILIVFTFSVNGQGSSKSASGSAISQVANGAGKVTVVVVGTAAKVAWETTKFTAKNVAKPMLTSVAKPLLLKVTPAVSIFALKLTGNAVKKAVPVVAKLGLAYLKAKLPI